MPRHLETRLVVLETAHVPVRRPLRFWDLSQKQEWAEVYKLVKSQTSVGALNALGVSRR